MHSAINVLFLSSQQQEQLLKKYSLLATGYILWFMSFPASYIFCFQLMTDMGRVIWQRVAQNYLSIFTLSAGCWMDFVVEDFDIMDDYTQFLTLLQSVEQQMEEEGSRYSSSIRLTMLETGSNLVSMVDKHLSQEKKAILLGRDSNISSSVLNDFDDEIEDTSIRGTFSTVTGTTPSISKKPKLRFQKRGEALVKVANDPTILFQQYLGAIVKVRVVLLQIVSVFTIWSILAVELAGSPIFVFSETLNKKLPPLLVKHPFHTAELLLEDDARHAGQQHVESWKVFCLGSYILIMQSRLIQFVFTLINTFAALIIVFDHSNQRLLYLVISMIIGKFLIIGFAYAFYLLLLVHRYMFPLQSSHEDDTENKDKDKTHPSSPPISTNHQNEEVERAKDSDDDDVIDEQNVSYITKNPIQRLQSH